MSSRLILAFVAMTAAAQFACSASGKTVSCNEGLKANDKGKCVECLATTDCTAGTYCDDSGVCAACSGSPTSCSTANGSCMADGDCGGNGKICESYVCVDGCANNSACGTGKYCDSATHRCAAGCGMDSQCSGNSCCDHVCTDTQTNPAANCGGCGMPACATGDSCCSGGCADLQTDTQNCGTCGNACAGSIACVDGVCQDGYGLFGLFGVTGKVAGDSTSNVILKPFIYTRAGTLDYTQLLSHSCFASHYDAAHPQTLELDAGNVLFSGFAGGTFINSMTAPTDIACQFGMGDYSCGYGMLMNNMLGTTPGQSPFAAGTAALGSTAITISAPGGDSFGSFSLSATPGTSIGVMEDLSTVTYTSTADVTLHLNCSGASCGGGAFLVYVQASSNDVAHFDEPAAAGGSLVCLGGFGSIFGQALGDPWETISQTDIATMLGGDASIKTFQTTVVTLGQSDLLNIVGGRSTDSQGRQVVGLALTGAYGVSTIP